MNIFIGILIGIPIGAIILTIVSVIKIDESLRQINNKTVDKILNDVNEYRDQCEEDCKDDYRCEKCNKMLFNEIEVIIRRNKQND